MVSPGSARLFVYTLNQGQVGIPLYPFMFLVSLYRRKSQQKSRWVKYVSKLKGKGRCIRSRRLATMFPRQPFK